MKTANQNIPEQTDGRRTDFADAMSFENLNDAHQKYLQMRDKLKDVSNWHNVCGRGSATFGLTDKKGNLLNRLAKTGDYFYIDLPATPGPDAGDGLEWVYIESIKEEGDDKCAEEYISIMIRPVPDPRHHKKGIAHFLSDVSTNTFIVSRSGLKVSAEVHGRNEKPNNKDVDLHDTIRNTAIALSARVGLSGPQWMKLVNGLLAK